MPHYFRLVWPNVSHIRNEWNLWKHICSSITLITKQPQRSLLNFHLHSCQYFLQHEDKLNTLKAHTVLSVSRHYWETRRSEVTPSSTWPGPYLNMSPLGQCPHMPVPYRLQEADTSPPLPPVIWPNTQWWLPSSSGIRWEHLVLSEWQRHWL